MLTKLTGLVLALAASSSLGQEQEELCFSSLIREGPPGNVFSSGDLAVSTISSRSSQRCGLQYPECFLSKGIPYVEDPGFLVPDGTVCREVLQYTVPLAATLPPAPEIGVSENANCKSPDLSDPCVCQLPVSYSTLGNVTFEVSLTTENCCQQCSCIGDVSEQVLDTDQMPRELTNVVDDSTASLHCFLGKVRQLGRL